MVINEKKKKTFWDHIFLHGHGQRLDFNALKYLGLFCNIIHISDNLNPFLNYNDKKLHLVIQNSNKK